jgi:hypothetical protein
MSIFSFAFFFELVKILKMRCVIMVHFWDTLCFKCKHDCKDYEKKKNVKIMKNLLLNI